MNEPFISINRQMFDGLINEFQGRQKSAIRTLWFYLLYHANWADNGELKRGQIFVGRRSLAMETGLTERTVRTLLNTLKSVPHGDQQLSHIVSHQVSHKGSVITIPKYDSWVMKKKDSVPQDVPQGVQQVSHRVTTTEVIENNKTNKKPYLSANADVQKIFEHYGKKINSKSKLTKSAIQKITTRLRTFSVEELTTAIDKFCKDDWWVEKNSRRGVAWFFNNDDRIDQFLNMEPGRFDDSQNTDDLYEPYLPLEKESSVAAQNGQVKICSPPQREKIK